MPDGRTDLEILIRTTAEMQGIKLTEEGLQQIKERTQELAHNSSAATEEFKGFTDAQKAQAQALADSLPPLQQTADGTEKLGRTLVGTKLATAGLSSVIGGLVSGDLLQMSKGFLDLHRAAASATGAMKGFFSSVASGAGVGALIAAPILLAIHKWTKAAEEADKQMQEIWAGQGKSTKALADAQEEATQRMIKNNDALEASYRKVTDEINDTARAESALAAEKTKQAALLAASPEERAKIEQAAEIEQAQRDVSTADQAQRAAVALSGDDRTVRRSNDDLAIAKARLETARLGRQKAAPTPSGGAPLDAGRAAELRSTAESAQARGDFASQDAAVAELRKMNAAAKAFAKATGDNASATTKSLDKGTQKLKLAQQSSAGGGG